MLILLTPAGEVLEEKMNELRWFPIMDFKIKEFGCECLVPKNCYEITNSLHVHFMNTDEFKF